MLAVSYKFVNSLTRRAIRQQATLRQAMDRPVPCEVQVHLYSVLIDLRIFNVPFLAFNNPGRLRSLGMALHRMATVLQLR